MTATLERPALETPATAVGWGPLAVVLAGTVVTFLDFFIVNVALPSIRGGLHADAGSVSMVVAGYGLTFAAGMIPGGRLGDLYGRRRMFTLGLALFTLTSAGCGLAPTAGLLVAARLLQGAAGALLTPQVLALVRTTYAAERQARAFAAYGFAMGIAGVLGQLLGGALIAGFGWRAVFLVNVPVGLATLPFVRRVVPESHGDRQRLDLAGALLGTAAVTALVLPLVEGREHGWPLWCWLSLAASPVLAVLFVRREGSTPAPLIDLGLFRDRSFGVGSLAALTFALVPGSFFFALALFLQQGRGYSALFSGTVFIAVGVGYFAAMVGAGPLAARLGPNVLALGASTCAAGFVALLAGTEAATAWALVPGLALVGAGIGLVLVPVSSLVLAGVDPRHAGAAAGVLAAAQQVGGALGVAVTGTVYFAAGFDDSLVLLAGVTVLTIGLARRLSSR